MVALFCCCYILFLKVYSIFFYLCITAYLIILLRFSLSPFTLVILLFYFTFPKPYLFSFALVSLLLCSLSNISLRFLQPIQHTEWEKKQKKERKIKKATVKRIKKRHWKILRLIYMFLCCVLFFALFILFCSFFFVIITLFFIMFLLLLWYFSYIVKRKERRRT